MIHRAIFSILIAGSTAGDAPLPPFRPRRVARAFPPIVAPPTLPASRARGQVRGPELVLGVTVGDESRAYPINMLTGPTREIINDTLGGTAIAATW
jgi:hypothetical protein